MCPLFIFFVCGVFCNVEIRHEPCRTRISPSDGSLASIKLRLRHQAVKQLRVIENFAKFSDLPIKTSIFVAALRQSESSKKKPSKHRNISRYFGGTNVSEKYLLDLTMSLRIHSKSPYPCSKKLGCVSVKINSKFRSSDSWVFISALSPALNYKF